MVRLVVQAIGEALFADRTASEIMVEWTPPSGEATWAWFSWPGGAEVDEPLAVEGVGDRLQNPRSQCHERLRCRWGAKLHQRRRSLQDYPITKAIYELYQLLGDGRLIASALGVWAMCFLGTTMVVPASSWAKKLGAIFRV